MTADETKSAAIGVWQSIATEVRASAQKNQDGTLKPFYLSRKFTLELNDQFDLELTNFADANGKVPLAKIHIRGHVEWKGDHPVARGAQKADFIADIDYVVNPLHPGFADLLNKISSNGYSKWQLNEGQQIFRKAFAPFGLAQGQIFKEYDLIYVHQRMMFWGARHIDGRGFDTEANRPENLQIPMIRG